MSKLDLLLRRTETTVAQNICRALLGMFLLFTGTGHLTFLRDEFPAQVPNWVHLDIDLIVVLSGIVELLLGACLVVLSRYKVLAGLAAALFFVAIFPGNISQFLNQRDAFGLDTDLKRGVRLLFQPVLVGWALWASGAWKVLIERGNG